MIVEFTVDEVNTILSLLKQVSISPFQQDALQALQLTQGIIAKLTQIQEK